MENQDNISFSSSDKDHWNGFVDHLQGDYPTTASLNEYNDKNPKSQLNESHIPAALNYISNIKQNTDIAGLTPAYKNGNNMRFPVTADGKHPDLGGDPTAIPKPDYNNPASRLQYAQQFSKKYGEAAHGRGDFPLRVNEIPENGTDTAKNLSVKAASKFGLDPALVYSSAMEEGMSGIFPDKQGYVQDSGDKDFPTQGSASFGMDNFVKDFPGLVKKGYLPSDFAQRFKAAPSPDPTETQNSANYKTPDDALLAKAAVMKNWQDQTEDYAKKIGVTLSPKQREFMTLVAYNSGGNMQKMMKEYKDKGLLTDDKVDKDPTGHWTTITKHVAPRLQMRDALKKEGLF